MGITVGADGNLWYAENNGPTSGLIGMMTTGGQYTNYQLPTAQPGNFYVHPEGVTLGPDGNVWFSASSGYVGSISTAGSIALYPLDTANEGEFTSIVTGPDGNLWATENVNKGLSSHDQVWRITTAGNGTVMATLAVLARPNSIIAGPDGNLWFTETNVNRIAKLTTGGILSEYSIPIASSNPQQIVTGAAGDLWFTESGSTGTSVLVNMTTTGLINGEFPTYQCCARALATGPFSNLWFVDAKISSMANTGGTAGTYGATYPGTTIGGIVEGPDGAMWITDQNENLIFRVATSPAATSPPVTFTYTLGSTPYPPGFNPACGSALIAYANNGTSGTTQLSFAGGVEKRISLAACHASPGDTIKVNITSTYGQVVNSRIANGDFYVIDNTNDSGANVTITDLANGYHQNTTIFFSY